VRAAGVILALALSWPARAADGAYRAGFECAAALSVLGSFAGLSSDYQEADPYAEFEALGPQLELRIGGFLANRVALGAQVVEESPGLRVPGYCSAPRSKAST
jgi:hypothetical protein